MRATALDADPLLAGNLMHYLTVLVLGSQFIDEGNRTPVCLCKGVAAQRASARARGRGLYSRGNPSTYSRFVQLVACE